MGHCSYLCSLIKSCLPWAADFTPSHCVSNWAHGLFSTRSSWFSDPACDEWRHGSDVCSITKTEFSRMAASLLICILTAWNHGVTMWRVHRVGKTLSFFETDMFENEKLYFFFLARYVCDNTVPETQKNTWFRLRKRSFLYVYKGFRMFNSNYVHKNVTTSKQTKSNNGGLITWHTGVCYLCGAKWF